MKSATSVLHVVESFGGGVASALHQYTLATPGLTHNLLRTEREGDYIDSGETAGFDEVRSLNKNALRAIMQIRRTVSDLNPDVIHAHSSLAGLYVRLGIRSSPRRPIVYTPHGYASERADVPAITAKAYRLIESVLSINTGKYAACSPREASLSRFGRSSVSVVHVPNVANLGQLSAAPSKKPDVGAKFQVVGTGRLAPARDPYFFRDVARIVRRVNPAIEFVWVGGGDKRYRAALNEVGVTVTGWLPRNEALEAFAQADLHLHPSAWDGFPMVLLEANALRIPSIVRDIVAFAEVPEVVKYGSTERVAEDVLDAFANRSKLGTALRIWDSFLSENTQQVQSRRLLEAYGLPDGQVCS